MEKRNEREGTKIAIDILGIIKYYPYMDKSIERNKKFKIKYTKNDGETVRRFGIVNDDCRGLGNRQKDNRPFLHYFDLDKKGYRYATNWEIL